MQIKLICDITDGRAVAHLDPAVTASAYPCPHLIAAGLLLHAEYAELLRKCPISKAKLFDNSDIWLITKLKDVQAALTHDGLSKGRTNPHFPELQAGMHQSGA